MHTDWITALSALTTGIAIAGAVAGLRAPQGRRVTAPLTAIFALFALLCATPLVGALARPALVFHLPLLLPTLFALPIAVHRFAAGRIGLRPGRRESIRDAIAPGIAALVTAGFWLLPASSKTALFIEGRLPGGWAASALALVTFTLVLIWIVVSCAYLAGTIVALRRHRRRLKAFYSNTEQYELRWIDGFLVSLMALWAVAAIALAGDNLGAGVIVSEIGAFAATVPVLLLLITVSLAASPDGEAGVDLIDLSEPPARYMRSALSADRARQIARRIEAAMTREQVYLDANLSLQKLSRLVGAPPNHVSQTLNEHLHTAFFDYVARWRIEAAKPLLVEGGKSVLAIALEVGFNSRSTFYKAFKRETGLTPKAYQAQAASR